MSTSSSLRRWSDVILVVFYYKSSPNLWTDKWLLATNTLSSSVAKPSALPESTLLKPARWLWYLPPDCSSKTQFLSRWSNQSSTGCWRAKSRRVVRWRVYLIFWWLCGKGKLHASLTQLYSICRDHSLFWNTCRISSVLCGWFWLTYSKNALKAISTLNYCLA